MAVLKNAEILTVNEVLRDGKSEYTRVYDVITNKGDSPSIARQATGVPIYGSSYSYGGVTDLLALALDFKTDLIDHDVNWDGTAASKWAVQVTNRYFDSDKDSFPVSNPLDETWRISGSFVNKPFQATRDKDEEPLVNTLGDLLDPLPQDYELVDTLNLKWNSATISLGLRGTVRNRVNSRPM